MVPFTGSDVPLEDDLLPKPDINQRVFFPSFAEWASDGNIEQVIRSVTTEGIIFTVPANFTLFITNAWISARIPLGGSFSNINISNQTSFLNLDCDDGNVNSISMGYKMPVVVHSGDFIQVGTGGVNTTRAGFVGYLLPKKISIR